MHQTTHSFVKFFTLFFLSGLAFLGGPRPSQAALSPSAWNGSAAMTYTSAAPNPTSLSSAQFAISAGGSLTVTGGTLTLTNTLWDAVIGSGNADIGTLALSGGTLNWSATGTNQTDAALGRYGGTAAINISGGTFNLNVGHGTDAGTGIAVGSGMGGATGQAVITLSGGTFTSATTKFGMGGSWWNSWSNSPGSSGVVTLGLGNAVFRLNGLNDLTSASFNINQATSCFNFLSSSKGQIQIGTAGGTAASPAFFQSLVASGCVRIDGKIITDPSRFSYSTSGSLGIFQLADTQAPATFSTGGFVDDTILSLVGTPSQVVYAVNLASTGALTTANGYTFAPSSSYSSYINTNVTGPGAGCWVNGLLGGGGTSGDANFDAILNSGFYAFGNMVTLNNLIPGATYKAMFLAADTRSSSSGWNFSVTSGGLTSATQTYAFGAGSPTLGGYVLATFTATGSTQTFKINNPYFAGQLNAVVVATTGNTVAVAQSGSVFQDCSLVGNSSLGVTGTPTLLAGETKPDSGDSRVYLPFSISPANASSIQGCEQVLLYVDLSNVSQAGAYALTLCGYPNRGSVTAVQSGDYGAGTLLFSSVIPGNGPTQGWVAVDVTAFAIAQIDAGNRALDFKLQVSPGGLPNADGKQNCFSFCSATAGIATAPHLLITHVTVDTTSLRGKTLAGYQGWFSTPHDGINWPDNSPMGWEHWFLDNSDASPANPSMVCWPDMIQFTPAESEAVPGYTNPNGTMATLYSSVNPRTTLRHFQWMERAGIDGIWLSQFTTTFASNSTHMTAVRNNVISSARTTGRTWAFLWDTSGHNSSTMYSDLVIQWQKMVDQGVTSLSSNYLHHNGLPVLMLWGLIENDSNYPLGTPSNGILRQLITYFKTPGKYQAALVGGGEQGWLAYGSPDFVSQIMQLTAYSNWRGGQSYWASESSYCAAHNVLYIPTIDNNNITPQGGQWMWNQFQQASQAANINGALLAMFDENGEGDCIQPVSNTPPHPLAPFQPWPGETLNAFCTMEGYPYDWYMRLVGQGGLMLKTNTPITSTIPLSP